MCSYLSADNSLAIPEEAVTVELLLEHIIETFHMKNTEKLVLLVELGCIRHEAVQNINFLLELSEIAQVHDCCVDKQWVRLARATDNNGIYCTI